MGFFPPLLKCVGERANISPPNVSLKIASLPNVSLAPSVHASVATGHLSSFARAQDDSRASVHAYSRVLYARLPLR